MLKKKVMHTGLFTRNIANGRYAISIIATYYIEMKRCFCSAWNHRNEKFQWKNQSQIFDQIVSVFLRWAKPKNHRAKISHKKYRWFCGERTQKTTEPKLSIRSIGGFTVNKTDKRLKKFYRWFVGDFEW